MVGGTCCCPDKSSAKECGCWTYPAHFCNMNKIKMQFQSEHVVDINVSLSKQFLEAR